MTGLVSKGRIELANDAVTADLIVNDTETRTALGTVVDPLVAEAISEDPTIAAAGAAAATTAVGSEIAARDLIGGSDPRISEYGLVDEWNVVDATGASALAVRRNGDTEIGGVPFKPQPDSFSITDSANKLAFQVRPDGRTFIGDPVFGTPIASSTITKVHKLPWWGQSLGSGRGLPTTAALDPQDSRIYEVGAKVQTLRVASVPLDSHETVPANAGLSPATVYARELAKTLPAGEVVVIINSCHGGTGLVYQGASGGCWDPAYAGSNPKLYTLALNQMDAATALITSTWPTATQVWHALGWEQGETDGDNDITQSAYATTFDTLIAGFRTKVGDSTVPVIIGSMVAEYITASTHTVAAINMAHIDTQSRQQYVGFAYGAPNGSNSGDLVHPAREWVDKMGRAMLAARQRALSNFTASLPVIPQVVSATRVNGLLTINWSQPMARVTGYTVQYRVDGGAWTTITGRPSPLDTSASVTGVTGTVVQAQVRSANDSGSSGYSQTITAIGV